MRAYWLNASTMLFSAATWLTMVCVERASISASAPESLPASFASRRSAESWIGVSGLRDLVREAPRHLGPRRGALRLREVGDVVEHDDAARRRVPGGRRVPRSSSSCVPPRCGALDLLLPFRRSARRRTPPRGRRASSASPGPASLQRAELAVRRAARNPRPGSCRRCDWPSAAAGSRRTRARRRRGWRVCSRSRPWPARAAASWRSAAARASASCSVMLLNDCGEHADLVARCHRRALAEIAARHRARALDQRAERRRQPVGEHERERRAPTAARAAA